jgi:hypothetical protein
MDRLGPHPDLAAVLDRGIGRAAVTKGITVVFQKFGGKAACHCRNQDNRKYHL